MNERSMQFLTHSRMACAKTCLRRHYFAYELGIVKDAESSPLRMGQAVHLGLESKANGASVEEAITKATTDYLLIPVWADPDEWATERETVAQLLYGYFRIHESDAFEIVANEQVFDLPVVNPDTGRPATNFRLAGKIDKIIRLADGRLAVMEHKTTSDDLSSGSDYWPRLRLDQQISLYVLAARSLGYDVETVIYDVIRKPGIRPKLIKGIRETPEQYGVRLLEDICERPDFYFARKEIPRLESDLDEFKAELWQNQKLLRDCQIHGRWFRNSNACLFPFKCPYTDICFSGIDPSVTVPAGYVKKRTMHPELGDMTNDNHGNKTASAESAAASPSYAVV